MKRATVNRPRALPGTGARLDLRAVAATLLLLAVAVAGWVWFAGPALSTSHELTTALDSKQAQLDESRAKVDALKSGQSSGAPELLEQARALDEQLPATVEKVDVVALVPATAAGYGVSFSKMDAIDDGAAAALGANSLAFAATVTGGYDPVMAFLADITAPGAAPLMSVRDLSVTLTDEGATANFTLQVFYSGVPAL